MSTLNLNNYPTLQYFYTLDPLDQPFPLAGEVDLAKVTGEIRKILTKSQGNQKDLSRRIRKREWSLTDSNGVSLQPRTARDLQTILSYGIQQQENSLQGTWNALMGWVGVKTELEEAQEVLADLNPLVGSDAFTNKEYKELWRQKSIRENTRYAVCWHDNAGDEKFRFYDPSGAIYSVRVKNFKAGSQKELLQETRKKKACTATYRDPAGKKTEVLVLTNLKNRKPKKLNKACERLQTEHSKLTLLWEKSPKNFVKPYDFYTFNTGVANIGFLFEEYCEFGDLQQFMETREFQCLSQTAKRDLMSSLLKILGELHCKRYMHKDIKAINIGIVKNEQGKYCCKLFDVESIAEASNPSGISTPKFNPPEYSTFEEWDQKFNTQQKQKFDVWSLGLVFYQIHHGHPLSNPTLDIVQNRLRKSALTDPMDALICSMLSMDVDKRPSMREVRRAFRALSRP